MRLLKLAVKNQRWDLAAHTIVLATVRILQEGDRPDANGSQQKTRHGKGQAKRK